ncbi:hypothetical protein B0J13DRAFT_621655 [Dactylonectria estremocensis]|uniref:Uncharacterized protein n=1 Tax=Dactylonectria estremocensis TaxID=1079267 RepID=A0A9P9J2R4_9HYPO|nr:hypothetical protein B0J13DRAFT_621655 [Dactylonectria estremocensis]
MARTRLSDGTRRTRRTRASAAKDAAPSARKSAASSAADPPAPASEKTKGKRKAAPAEGADGADSSAGGAPSKKAEPTLPDDFAIVPFDPPCENCLKSVISRKGDFTHCHCAPGRAKRCWSCALGNHKSANLLLYLPGDLSSPLTRRASIRNLRTTVRITLHYLDHKPEIFVEGDQDPMPQGAVKQASGRSVTAHHTALMDKLTEVAELLIN